MKWAAVRAWTRAQTRQKAMLDGMDTDTEEVGSGDSGEDDDSEDDSADDSADEDGDEDDPVPRRSSRIHSSRRRRTYGNSGGCVGVCAVKGG